MSVASLVIQGTNPGSSTRLLLGLSSGARHLRRRNTCASAVCAHVVRVHVPEGATSGGSIRSYKPLLGEGHRLHARPAGPRQATPADAQAAQLAEPAVLHVRGAQAWSLHTSACEQVAVLMYVAQLWLDDCVDSWLHLRKGMKG